MWPTAEVLVEGNSYTRENLATRVVFVSMLTLKEWEEISQAGLGTLTRLAALFFLYGLVDKEDLNILRDTLHQVSRAHDNWKFKISQLWKILRPRSTSLGTRAWCLRDQGSLNEWTNLYEVLHGISFVVYLILYQAHPKEVGRTQNQETLLPTFDLLYLLCGRVHISRMVIA
jgi:hypothetical protein